MSATHVPDGYVHPTGNGRPVWFLGALLTWKATAATTGGQFELVEQHGRRGFGPPVHLHETEAEGFYVLEGQLTFLIEHERHDAPAGSFLYVPPGARHTFVVESPEAKFLTIVTPPGKFERFMDELSEPAKFPGLPPPMTEPPDIAGIEAAAARYGQQMVGPPLQPSGEANTS